MGIYYLTCGICWTIAYVLVIRRSWCDKTYGMPLVACSANVAWEFIFTFIIPYPDVISWSVNLVWLILDLVILAQVVIFFPREYPRVPKAALWPLVCLSILFSFLFLYAAHRDGNIVIVSAFPQNFMMSALFLGMLIARQDVRGQSLYIACFRLLGTGIVALNLYLSDFYPGLFTMKMLFVGIIVCDVYYIFLYCVRCHRLSISPWRRL